MLEPRGHNARGTLKVTNHSGARTLHQLRRADMAALERLPRHVRWMLKEFNINLDVCAVEAYYLSIARQAQQAGGSAMDAEAWTLRKLMQIEASDIDKFSIIHKGRYGYPLPHVAAEVSVLRYGPLERHGKRVARRAHTNVWLPPEILEAA